jgi:hypothetical protein
MTSDGLDYNAMNGARGVSDPIVNEPPMLPAEPYVPPMHTITPTPIPAYPAPASGYPDGNPKTAIGLTKPSMSNLPSPALLPIMKAFADGARKYGMYNWREKGVSASVYYDAAMRHLMSWWDGEDNADDSKVHHLGHAAACMMILMDAEFHRQLNDNRVGSGVFTEMAKAMTVTA